MFERAAREGRDGLRPTQTEERLERLRAERRARPPFATPSSKASVRGPARFAREANCAVTIRAPAYCSAEAAGAKPASR